jgi:penicillin G amidase
MFKRSLLMVCLFVLGGMLSLSNQKAASTSPNYRQEETIALPGLDGEVTVKYDSFDVPHIYATTEHDLFMAQGYVTAQLRWWQMEWSRKQARGQLASLMGEEYVGTDSFLRTMGLAAAAENDYEMLSDQYQDILQAYADGINAWIGDKTPEELAIEYTYLDDVGGAAPESIDPWTPLDTVVFGKVAAFSFAQSSLENELVKGGIVDAGGPIAALLLAPPYDYENAPLVSQPGRERAGIFNTPFSETEGETTRPRINFAAYDVLANFPFATGELRGSNSWVISGEMTDTGLPYLANDPHIGQNTPSVWIEIGLHAPEVGWDAYGYIFPGAPGILVGHNANLAWGLTVNGLDYIDIYSLEISPDNPDQYMYNGDWVDLEIRTETIEVANGDPVELPIRVSQFGPIFNHILGLEGTLAARAILLEPNTGIEIVYRLPRASNWEEFQEAAALFDIAGQNAVYADVEGNIGVIAMGKIPVRPAGDDGTVPRPGIDSSTEWQGFIDPMDNPRLFNPEAGFIVAANNAFLTPEEFPTTFGYYYDYGWRASRIEQLIQETDVMTIERMAEIQNDTFNPAAGIILPYLEATDFGSEAANAARDYLSGWDMMNDADSGQAALFNAFWAKLMPLVFDELDAAGGVQGGSREIFIMRNMVGGAHPLWANAALETNDPVAIIAQALEEGWAMTEEMLGDDPTAWRWDGLHISHTRHVPLGEFTEEDGYDVEEINELFNRQIGVPGGLDSVSNQRWDPRNGNFELSGAIVSMRMIVDFSDLDNSRFINELGQSGDPNSPHYDDMSPLWATGQYLPHGFTPSAVDALTVRTVTLTPGE